MEIKDQLIEDLNKSFKKRKEFIEYFQKNASNPQEIEKTLKIQLGAVTIKATFIEASILTIANILRNYLQVDVETILSKEDYFTYYTLNNHAAYSLDIEESKLKQNEEFDKILSNIKNQIIENGSKE